jgi:predicted lipid-binding transport protein (Tim44 family)
MKHLLALGALVALPLIAAEPPPASPAGNPAADAAAMQPAVNTSPTSAAQAPSSARPAAAPAPAANRGATPAAAAGAQAPRPRAQDRLELDTTQITGNRELPRVLYVVPWKRSDLGDLAGRPANSLLDEVLAPVDRDVFKRQNRYYDALKPDAAGGGAKGEK